MYGCVFVCVYGAFTDGVLKDSATNGVFTDSALMDAALTDGVLKEGALTGLYLLQAYQTLVSDDNFDLDT